MKRRRGEVPRPVTVLQLWREQQEQQKQEARGGQALPPLSLLPSSSSPRPSSDAWLQLTPGVYELSGEAGAGKTQVALALCQRAAASRHSAASTTTKPAALYLAMGAGRLPKVLQRLQQMATAATQRAWLDCLLTKPLLQRDDWTDFLREADTFLGQHASLRLIVVDSLADIVRDDHGHYSQFDRTTWLLSWVSRAKVLANRYNITWLLINQQAAGPSSAVSGMWESRPALGLAWAHAVQASWICRKHAATKGRSLVLYKSSRHAVGQTAAFTITPAGVLRSVEETPPPTTTTRNSPLPHATSGSHSE
jgi:RecA/RadA recombinase